MHKDTIFAKNSPQNFQFNSRVAAVFDNMIQRSVPGYVNISDMCAIIATHFLKHGDTCCDFGCSTANTFKCIANMSPPLPNVHFIGVDNSQAMLDQARQSLGVEKQNIELIHADIIQWQPPKMRLAFCNFTLQFIAINKRAEVLRKIYRALEPNGILVLSEKVVSSKLLIKLHEQSKLSNGYSHTEIVKKRDSLEDFLVPESETTHYKRLREVGFNSVEFWFRCFNFISFIAIK